MNRTSVVALEVLKLALVAVGLAVQALGDQESLLVDRVIEMLDAPSEAPPVVLDVELPLALFLYRRLQLSPHNTPLDLCSCFTL
jgi:hypothetical protein